MRAQLSHKSVLYAIIGGTATVLFWRGIWHTADILQAQGGIWGFLFYEPITIVWCSLILLFTGLFVSNFIGERVILSGLNAEKKLAGKEQTEIKKEDVELSNVIEKVNQISEELNQINEVISKK